MVTGLHMESGNSDFFYELCGVRSLAQRDEPTNRALSLTLSRDLTFGVHSNLAILMCAPRNP